MATTVKGGLMASAGVVGSRGVVKGGTMATAGIRGTRSTAKGGAMNSVPGGNVVIGDPYMFASARATAFSWGVLNTPVGANPTNQGGYIYEYTEIAQPMMPYRQVSPRLCYHAFHVNQTTNETLLGNNLQISACGIRVGTFASGTSVIYALKGGASLGFTVTDGSHIWTDEDLSVIVPPMTPWSIITCSAVDNSVSACTRPAVFKINGSLDPAIYGTGQSDRRNNQNSGPFSLASTSFGANTPGNYTAHGPCAVVSKWWDAAGRPPVVLGIGDSRMWGADEGIVNSYPTTGVNGWFSRGLIDANGGRMAHGNWAVSGLNFSDVAASTFVRRKAILVAMNFPYTCVASGHWTNQFSPDSCIENWNTYADFIYTLGQKPLIQVTAHARNEAQDLVDPSRGRSTVANQNLRLVWGKFSDWVRNAGQTSVATTNFPGGAPLATRPFKALELGGIVESAINSTKWKVPGFTTTLVADRTTTDNSAVNMILADAPRVGAYLFTRNNAGTIYGASYVRAVSGSAGNYTVTTWQASGNPVGLVEAGTSVIEVYTRDGIHESGAAAIDLSVAAIAAKTNGVFV